MLGDVTVCFLVGVKDSTRFHKLLDGISPNLQLIYLFVCLFVCLFLYLFMAYQRNVNRSTEAKVATYSYNITA